MRTTSTETTWCAHNARYLRPVIPCHSGRRDDLKRHLWRWSKDAHLFIFPGGNEISKPFQIINDQTVSWERIREKLFYSNAVFAHNSYSTNAWKTRLSRWLYSVVPVFQTLSLSHHLQLTSPPSKLSSLQLKLLLKRMKTSAYLKRKKRKPLVLDKYVPINKSVHNYK